MKDEKTELIFEGINPEKLDKKYLKEMPIGARLLESEEERLAFENEAKELNLPAWKGNKDLYWFLPFKWIWSTGSARASIHTYTYCTTREKGWWK